MEKSCKICEIFESIQGEGIFVGQKHLFIRLLGCNLNCKYCDTNNFSEKKAIILTKSALYEEIKHYGAQVISFTGGEPLLQSEFLRDFLAEYKSSLKKQYIWKPMAACHTGLERLLIILILFQWILSWNLPQEKK